jgi:hypothetical protein
MNGKRDILVATESELIVIDGSLVFGDDVDEEIAEIDNFDRILDDLSHEALLIQLKEKQRQAQLRAMQQMAEDDPFDILRHGFDPAAWNRSAREWKLAKMSPKEREEFENEEKKRAVKDMEKMTKEWAIRMAEEAAKEKVAPKKTRKQNWAASKTLAHHTKTTEGHHRRRKRRNRSEGEEEENKDGTEQKTGEEEERREEEEDSNERVYADQIETQNDGEFGQIDEQNENGDGQIDTQFDNQAGQLDTQSDRSSPSR